MLCAVCAACRIAHQISFTVIERVMEVCVRIVYFTTLPIAQPVWRRMVWREAAVAYSKYCVSICLVGLKKTTKISVIVAGFPTVIWTEYIPNKRLASYQYACLHDRVGSCVDKRRLI
jgi:hypothetical protein